MYDDVPDVLFDEYDPRPPLTAEQERVITDFVATRRTLNNFDRLAIEDIARDTLADAQTNNVVILGWAMALQMVRNYYHAEGLNHHVIFGEHLINDTTQILNICIREVSCYLRDRHEGHKVWLPYEIYYPFYWALYYLGRRKTAPTRRRDYRLPINAYAQQYLEKKRRK